MVKTVIRKIKGAIGDRRLHGLRLSLHLAVMDFKLRNERSYLGLLWYVLDPVLLFAVIYGLRAHVAPSADPQYAAYLFSGLVVFSFFRRTSTLATRAISGNASLTKSMVMPHEPLVLSKVIDSVFGHAFEIVALAVLMVAVGVPIANLIFYIPILALLIVFLTGLSFFLAALGAFATDVINAWGVIVGLLMFASPVFYKLPEGSELSFIHAANPMTAFLEAARGALLNGVLPEPSLMLLLLGWSAATCSVGILVFRSLQRRFSEAL